MALAQLKADATEARLADVALPEGAAWANEARSQALARVRQMGVPTKRDEYWKYTDPASLVTADAPEAAVFKDEQGRLFDSVDRVKIVFVDGVFDPDASDDLQAEGVEIERLSEALAADIHLSLIHI